MRPELGLLLEHVLPRPSQGYNKLYCYYDNDDDIDHRSLSHPGWLVLVYIIPRELLLYTPWLLMVFLPFFFFKKKKLLEGYLGQTDLERYIYILQTTVSVFYFFRAHGDVDRRIPAVLPPPPKKRREKMRN